MRLAPLVLLALAACQPGLETGETWASEADAFEGIMAVLEDGLRPCTVELKDPALEARVLAACRELGLARYPVGQAEAPVDMHLKFERVILHSSDVLRVRCRNVFPESVWRSSYIIVREHGSWTLKGSSESQGQDYPTFNQAHR